MRDERPLQNKVTRAAEEAAHHLRELERCIGVPLLDDGRLWLLSHPARRPPAVADLREAIQALELPGRAALGRWIGAREVIALDVGTLARWGGLMRRMERRNLERLLKTGSRRLGRYGIKGLRRRLKELRAAVDQLSLLYRGAQVAPGLHCESSLVDASPADVASVLALRIHTLATWRPDPLEALCHSPSFAPALRTLFRESPDPLVRGLAAWVLKSHGRAARIALACSNVRDALDGEVLTNRRPDPADVSDGCLRIVERVAVLSGAAAGCRLLRMLRSPNKAPRIPAPQTSNALGRTGMRETLAVTAALAHPHLELDLPERLDDDSAKLLLRILEEAPEKQIRVVWPTLIERGVPTQDNKMIQLMTGRGDPDLLRRALEQGAFEAAWTLRDHPQGLRSYLDCFTELEKLPQIHEFLQEEWFLHLFLLDGAWLPSLVLGLVAGEPDRPALDVAASLHATSRILHAGGGELLADLDAWYRPVLRDPPEEVGALQEILDEPAEVIMAYLHHRRLTGAGDTFSDVLLEPLRLAGRIERNDDGSPAEGTRERTSRETDLSAAVERAKQTLRSIATLQAQSLSTLLRKAAARSLERILGSPAQRLMEREHLWEMLQFLNPGVVETELVRSFLEDLLTDRPVADRPPNQAWIAASQRAGMRTEQWLAGVDTAKHVGSSRLRFSTETDPMRVARICAFLSAREPQSSLDVSDALLIAMDVNKQVVLVQDKLGRIVAVKLIAATLGGALVGYQTHIVAQEFAVKEALERVILDFAAACNLRPSDTGRPESLNGEYLYHGEIEPWTSQSGAAVPSRLDPSVLRMPGTAPPFPEDPSGRLERWFVEAAKERDLDRLLELCRQPESMPFWANAARKDVLLCLRRDVALRRSVTQKNPHIFHPLVSAGPIIDGPLRYAPAEYFDELDFIWQVKRDLSPTPGSARAGANFLEFLVRRSGAFPRDYGGCCSNPFCHCFITLDPEELAGLLTTMSRVWMFWQGSGNSEWRDSLRVALARENPSQAVGSALCRLGHRCPDVVIGVLQHIAVPGVRTFLKRRLRTATQDLVAGIALALGTQEDPEDAPLLLDLLRQNPTSLHIAAAVVRTGDPASALVAAELLQIKGDGLEEILAPPLLNFAREVQSPRLLKQVRRRIRRLIAGGADIQQIGTAVLQLAALGAPAPDGDPEPLIEEISRSGSETQSRSLSDLWDTARWFWWFCRGARSASTTLTMGDLPKAEGICWWTLLDDLFGGELPEVFLGFYDHRMANALLRCAGAGSSVAQRAEAAWLIVRLHRILGLDGLPGSWIALSGLVSDIPQELHTETRQKVIESIMEQLAELGEDEWPAQHLWWWLATLPGDLQDECIEGREIPALDLSTSGLEDGATDEAQVLARVLGHMALDRLFESLDSVMQQLSPSRAEQVCSEALDAFVERSGGVHMFTWEFTSWAKRKSARLQRLIAQRVFRHLDLVSRNKLQWWVEAGGHVQADGLRSDWLRAVLLDVLPSLRR